MSILRKTGILFLFALCTVYTACDDNEDPAPVEVTADFSFSIEGLTVVFENTSTNGRNYQWDFGDESTSQEESPTYSYSTGGQYTVTLTVSNGDVEDETSEIIIIEEQQVDQEVMALLTGDESKTWVLANEDNAINFGPIGDPGTIWWGNSVDVASDRSCMWNNEFTFTSSGDYSRNVNGDIWKEWKVFDAESGEGCLATSEEAINKFGENVDNWKDGQFTFQLVKENGAEYIVVTGNGGYVGHYTAGVETSNYVPNDLYKYEITSITENRLELSAFGWGGDSNEISGWDENQPDRTVRLILVPLN